MTALDTTSKTWTVGAVVTAADMNTEIRDKVEAIKTQLATGKPGLSMTDITSAANATAASGWTVTNAQYLIDGGWCQIYLTVSYNAAITPPTSGNLANMSVCTLPAPVRPQYGAQGLAIGAAGNPANFYINTDGSVGLGGMSGPTTAGTAWNVTGVFHI